MVTRCRWQKPLYLQWLFALEGNIIAKSTYSLTIRVIAIILVAGVLGIRLTLFLCAFQKSEPTQPGPQEELPFETNVRFLGGANRILDITIVNNSDKPVEFMEARLPWRHWYSMTLVLVKADATRRVIDMGNQGIDDPGAVVVKIESKSSIHGEIHLLKYYPEIDEILKDCGVDVFYAYQFSSLDRESGRRNGG